MNIDEILEMAINQAGTTLHDYDKKLLSLLLYNTVKNNSDPDTVEAELNTKNLLREQRN